jgi:hypothetical protein
MNTPAHIAVNLLLLTSKDRLRAFWPAVAGSVAPDVPILVFYAWERLLQRLPEQEIWSKAYFQPAWQAVFDLAHSIPLAAAACLVFAAVAAEGAAVFSAAVGLHALGDLVLHHSDAHRHLFPFSDWRFHSPVSYWDPAYHGVLFSALEILAVLASAWVVARRFPHRRGWIAALMGIYGFYWIYVAVVWM